MTSKQDTCVNSPTTGALVLMRRAPPKAAARSALLALELARALYRERSRQLATFAWDAAAERKASAQSYPGTNASKRESGTMACACTSSG